MYQNGESAYRDPKPDPAVARARERLGDLIGKTFADEDTGERSAGERGAVQLACFLASLTEVYLGSASSRLAAANQLAPILDALRDRPAEEVVTELIRAAGVGLVYFTGALKAKLDTDTKGK